MLWRTYECCYGWRPFLNPEGDSSSSNDGLSWEDIPLLKYESELLVKCGAWKSIFDIEDSLTIDELFLLYRAANADFSMNLKAMAASQGADVDWEDDWYSRDPNQQPEVLEANDMRFMPIGLGYEAV